MLFRKLLRTMGEYKAQFISMVVMVVLGMGVFVGFNMEWYTIETDVSEFFEDTGFADYRLVDETGFSLEDLDRVSGIDGVDRAARYLSVNTLSAKDKDTVTLTVTTDPKVSGFIVTSGSEYEEDSTDGIWMSDRYADANGITVGDDFTIIYKGMSVTGTVKGLVKSGEYLIFIPGENQLMPDYGTSGFVYISPAMLVTALGYGYYPQINVLSDMDKDAFIEAVDEALGRTALVLEKDDIVSYAESNGEAEEGKTRASVLPPLFLAIAILTMLTTMNRITVNEKMQIGTLKALGYRNRTIRMHYTMFALIVAVLGSIFGIILGYGLASFIMDPAGSMGTYFDMPDWTIHTPGMTYLILVLMDVLLVFVGWVSVSKMLKGTAADSLRPYVPRKMRPLAIERTSAWDRLGFSTKWNIRDLFKHKARSAVTVIGVMGCVLLLVASFGMRDTMDEYIDVFYGDAMNYETVINISDDATDEQAMEICRMYDGDWASKTSVQLEGDAVGLEIYNIMNDHVRFVDQDMNLTDLSDDGAYICGRIAKDTGVGIGDTLTFTTYITSQAYSVRIVGILSSISESIIMTSAYADFVGMDYSIRTVYTDATDIASDPAIESTLTKESIVRSFDTFMEIMNEMILLLAIAAVILGLVVLYNLGTMSYMERMRELATLKVVGFRDRQIGRILIGQNTWLTIVGIVIGVPIGLFVLDYLLHELASEYEMSMCITWVTYVITIVTTLAVSLMVSLMIGMNNRKIDMVSALKGGE